MLRQCFTESYRNLSNTVVSNTSLRANSVPSCNISWKRNVWICSICLPSTSILPELTEISSFSVFFRIIWWSVWHISALKAIKVSLWHLLSSFGVLLRITDVEERLSLPVPMQRGLFGTWSCVCSEIGSWRSTLWTSMRVWPSSSLNIFSLNVSWSVCSSLDQLTASTHFLSISLLRILRLLPAATLS